MKHADLVERCAIAASGLSEAEFRVIDEAQRSHYRLAAYRVLYEAFEALKEPTPEMESACWSHIISRDDHRSGVGGGIAAAIRFSPLNPES